MQGEETVFQKTYENYLQQLRQVSFESIAWRLGGELEGDALKVRCFGDDYRVSVGGITAPSGKRPGFDLCVILSKYLLLCPDIPPQGNDWVSFRNFKDAAPLTSYFTHEVERVIASLSTGRLDDLWKASKDLGGYPPVIEVDYDLAVQFDALPKIPVILLFNDADEEFPATCAVLFERKAEKYLDAECIAMLGGQLFSRLRKAME
jgi:hypothetical protein